MYEKNTGGSFCVPKGRFEEEQENDGVSSTVEKKKQKN